MKKSSALSPSYQNKSKTQDSAIEKSNARSKSVKNSTKQKTTTRAKQPAVSSVRIIGGQFKRRSVSFIDADGLRPTPDRLRETLFNWLLADIHGARVLDSCAGSGVLGLEALSRGAEHCTFIEANLLQAQTLRQTFAQLHLDDTSYQLVSGKAEQVLLQQSDFKQPFDIIFIDPPYAQALWHPILLALLSNNLLHADTVIYLEADKDLSVELSELIDHIHQDSSNQFEPLIDTKRFVCLKQTKVGQVVAGLYQLSSS